MSVTERREWAKRSVSQIKETFSPVNNYKLFFLCGNKYYEFIEEPIKEAGYDYEIPLDGKGGIGCQLAYLKEQLDKVDSDIGAINLWG